MTRIAYLLAAFLILSSCGRNQKATDTQIGTVEPSSKIRLFLFAKGNCGPCREELPEIQKRLESYSPYINQRILPTLYVIGNQTGSIPVSKSYADQFATEVSVKFDTQADSTRKIFTKYYSFNAGAPGTVILNEASEVIKIYPIGSVDLDILFSDLDNNLK